MTSRLRRAAAALVLLGLLAGCASIPSAGPVAQGEPRNTDDSVEIDIIASGPRAGASQEEILRGFLDAAASPQSDYRVARSFLTSSFSKNWRPDQGTTIDRAAARNVTAGAGESASLTVFPVATVSDTGSYSEAESGDSQRLEYAFSRVEGEWRISRAPQGVVIDEATFPIVFRANSLYFYSPDGRFLVPDVRWFARRESTQTSIVRALLAGPREWLEPGVRSAIPSGTRLESDAVPLVGQSAQVSLSTDALLESTELARLKVQLQTSLLGVSGVRSVDLEVNGNPIVPATLPNPIVTPRVDSRPVVLSTEGFGFVDRVDGSIAPLGELAGPLLALQPSAIALGPAARSAAALTPTGVYRVEAGESRLLLPGAGWIAPVVDPSGTVWSARSAARISWANPDGGSGELATAWGEGTLEALSVSRDGSRLVAALRTGGQTRILAAAIARPTGGGAPSAIGEPILLAQLLGRDARIDWIDPSRIAVLSHVDDEANVTTLTVGGTQIVATAPSSAREIFGGNSSREIRLRDDGGALLVPSGAGWQSRANQIRVLARQIGLD